MGRFTATDVSEKIKERLFVVLYRLNLLAIRHWLALCLTIAGFSVFNPVGVFGIRFADR